METQSFADVAYKTLTESLAKRNRVSLHTFSRYAPLFQIEEHRTGSVNLEELSAEFGSKFDLYAPIKLFDQNPDLPGAKCVQMIPPIFVKTKDSSQQNSAQDLAYEHFASASRRAQNQMLSTEVAHATKKLHAAISNIIDPASLEEAKMIVKAAVKMTPIKPDDNINVDDLFVD